MTTQSLPVFTDHNATQQFLEVHSSALQSIYADPRASTVAPVQQRTITVSSVSPALTCLVYEDVAAQADTSPQALNANDHSSLFFVDLLDLPGRRFLGRAAADVLPLGLLINSYPVDQIANDFDAYSAERAEIFRAVRETTSLAALLAHAEEQQSDFNVRHVHSITLCNEQQYQLYAPILVDSLLYHNPEDYDYALLIAGDRSEQTLVRHLNLKPIGRGSQCWFTKSPDMATYEDQWS